MNEKDIHDLIVLVERAPLANMQEAKAVAQLIERFVKHFAPKPAEQLIPDR